MAGSSRKAWFMIIIFLQVLLGTGGAAWVTHQRSLHGDNIAPGTRVSGVYLGGLPSDEARKLLQEKLAIPDSIGVHWNDRAFQIPLDHGVASYNVDKAVQDALRVGRETYESHTPHWGDFIRWFPRETELTATLEVAPSYLEMQLKQIKQKIDTAAVDAELSMENQVPVVRREVEGVRLDVQRSLETILTHLQDSQQEEIPLQVERLRPAVTAEDLPDYSQRLAYATTLLDLERENRLHNINLAVETISPTVIEPGEIVSLNDTLGPASRETGYLEDLVIENRQFVPGIGGGICQVATTIYQAALKAELDIMQRSNHSRPVTYVPLGQDATLSYNRIDLQIRNNREFPVMLVGRMNESLRFDFYGAEIIADRRVELVTEKEEVLEPRLVTQYTSSLPKGTTRIVQQGEKGYIVNVYRVIYEGDQKVARELISTDTYWPINELVHEGTREEEKPEK